MYVVNVDRGRTVKTVTIGGVSSEATRKQIFDYALLAAGETCHSIFGRSLHRIEESSVWTVSLWTD
jgi:hypothetical protein